MAFRDFISVAIKESTSKTLKVNVSGAKLNEDNIIKVCKEIETAIKDKTPELVILNFYGFSSFPNNGIARLAKIKKKWPKTTIQIGEIPVNTLVNIKYSKYSSLFAFS